MKKLWGFLVCGLVALSATVCGFGLYTNKTSNATTFPNTSGNPFGATGIRLIYTDGLHNENVVLTASNFTADKRLVFPNQYGGFAGESGMTGQFKLELPNGYRLGTFTQEEALDFRTYGSVLSTAFMLKTQSHAGDLGGAQFKQFTGSSSNPEFIVTYDDDTITGSATGCAIYTVRIKTERVITEGYFTGGGIEGDWVDAVIDTYFIEFKMVVRNNTDVSINAQFETFGVSSDNPARLDVIGERIRREVVGNTSADLRVGFSQSSSFGINDVAILTTRTGTVMGVTGLPSFLDAHFIEDEFATYGGYYIFTLKAGHKAINGTYTLGFSVNYKQHGFNNTSGAMQTNIQYTATSTVTLVISPAPESNWFKDNIVMFMTLFIMGGVGAAWWIITKIASKMDNDKDRKRWDEEAKRDRERRENLEKMRASTES